jgi:hypothetical protein
MHANLTMNMQLPFSQPPPQSGTARGAFSRHYDVTNCTVDGVASLDLKVDMQ